MNEAPVTLLAWLQSGTPDVGLVGGKAASLARLAAAGFRIPPGFCLTTHAFDAQIAAIEGAEDAIARLPDEEARVWLAERLERTPLLPSICDALDDALRQLDHDARLAGFEQLAVRSSGIGEDSSAASYAGLHATELGVAPGDVEGAVRRCWASLWSRPALAYRIRRSLSLDGGGMAVVVQALVPAETAAVAFSRHPVTGTDDVLVTAVRGLGDAMVEGSVTPDTIVVDRASGEIVDLVPADPSGGPVLTRRRLGELVEAVLEVERSFGMPVDVEAAATHDGWFLLQARPITTSVVGVEAGR